MIFSQKLLKQDKIKHGFFNKNGGSSKGIYKSLNCGIGSNDKKNQVIKNHGDHAIVFFDVVSYKTISERNLLTTNDLILKKIIL